MGLVSPGGVHSHQDHAVALARVAGAGRHPGRGARLHRRARHAAARRPPAICATCAAALPEGARIATVCGRYYAMDRDKRWDRVEQGLSARSPRRRGRASPTRRASIDDAYSRDVTDEFIVPAAVGDYRGMRDGDGVLCFNFRADRVRETARRAARAGLLRLRAPARDPLRRRRRHDLLQRRTGAAARRAVRAADRWRTCSARWLRDAGLAAVAHRRDREIRRTSPTSSTAGARSRMPGEDRIMVPSPKVATYDLQPEMSAPEVTDEARWRRSARATTT